MAGCRDKKSKSNPKPSEPEYIIKSPLDTNDYSYIELENGLRALLISSCPHEDATTNGKINPKTGVSLKVEEFNRKFIHISDEDEGCEEGNSSDDDECWEPSLKRSKLTDDYQRNPGATKAQEAWVSLCVGAGSLNDPEDLKGIAHLCEHMVCTYGSKRYPKSGLFKVVRSFGHGNAFTSAKYTTYYFGLDLLTAGVDTLTTCMDMLADAIANPNISPQSLKTEVGTVDSEFALKDYHDGRRLHIFFSSCFPKSHCLNKFGCGNRKTLDKPDLYQRVCKWLKRHYAANYMTLVINAGLPLEELEDMARKYFSCIPKSNQMSPKEEMIDKCTRLCHIKEFNRFYKVVPFADINLVSITWAIHDTQFAADFTTKPAVYLSRLLAEDSQIMSFMKSKNWVNGISTYFCSDTGMDYYCSPFCLIIYLTDLGVKDIFSLLQTVLSYLKMMSKRKPSEEVFNEIRKERADWFHYEKLYVDESVELSGHLHKMEDPKYILTARKLVTDFDPDFIQDYIQELTPWNMNVILVSKLHEVECTCQEEIYGTQFCAFEFLPKYLKSCENTKILPEVKGNCQQFENPFRPKNLICPVGNLPLMKVMRDEPKLFFKCTKTNLCSDGKVPVAGFRIFISCPMVPNTPTSTAFLELFNTLMFDSIETQIVQCARARIRVDMSSFYSCRRWIFFHIAGPSWHMEELVKSLFTNFKDFEKNLDEKTFANHLELHRKGLDNASLCPLVYGSDVLNYIINMIYEPIWQIKSATNDSTFRDFKNFISALKERMAIFGLLSGCVSEAQGVNMLSAIEKLNYRQPPSIPVNPNPRMMELPLGEKCICFKARSTDIHISIVTNFYQFGPLGEIDRKYFFSILGIILRPAASHQLRKVERLSYAVSTQVKVSHATGKGKPHGVGLVINLVAQSNRHSTGYIDERIDAFLAEFRKGMNNYENFIASNSFPRWLLNLKIYGPNLHKRLIKLYDEYLLPLGRKFRKLSVQVTGNSGNCNPVQASTIFCKIEKYKPNKTSDGDTSSPIFDLVHNLEYDIPPEVDHVNGYYVNDIEAFKDSMDIFSLPAD